MMLLFLLFYEMILLLLLAFVILMLLHWIYCVLNRWIRRRERCCSGLVGRGCVRLAGGPVTSEEREIQVDRMKHNVS
jgi:hypothetical protein